MQSAGRPAVPVRSSNSETRFVRNSRTHCVWISQVHRCSWYINRKHRKLRCGKVTGQPNLNRYLKIFSLRSQKMRTRILLLVWMLLWGRYAHGQGTSVSVDIGSRTPVGTTLAADNGFNVSSSTGDIWGFGDDCRFVYQSVSGDFDFQARIASLVGTAYWAKAGLMLRSGLTDSSAACSPAGTRAQHKSADAPDCADQKQRGRCNADT